MLAIQQDNGGLFIYNANQQNSSTFRRKLELKRLLLNTDIVRSFEICHVHKIATEYHSSQIKPYQLSF